MRHQLRPRSVLELSASEARRIAIAAQQFGPRAAGADRVALQRLAGHLGAIQLDSVNVLVRSHYLPAFSRLGAYDRAELDSLSHVTPRALFEYWGHQASLLPVALHPLLRWRMATAGEAAWGHVRRMARRRSFLADVMAIVTERGPIGAGDLEVGKKGRAGWWEWSEAKRAIEWLFWSGQVTTAGRRSFERLYDLTERVLPAGVLAAPTPSPRDAQRELVAISARALGLATETDLRDYFRLKQAVVRPAIADLVEEGVIERVAVEGWEKPAYLHREAPVPREGGDRAALLSPFDALVWSRERTERVFGMKFRLEIYVPKPKRLYGYYVLPFLLGDELVARVDLKADRAAGTLRVQAAHAEPRAKKAATAVGLAGELRAMASWLGLERVEVVGRGDLSVVLRKALKKAMKKAVKTRSRGR